MAIKIYEQFAPFANPADGDYPHGSFKNDSIPGAEDGTPLDATWGNDMVGFTDALLAEAGIVPNGQPDTVGNSQRVDAMRSEFQDHSKLSNLDAVGGHDAIYNRTFDSLSTMQSEISLIDGQNVKVSTDGKVYNFNINSVGIGLLLSNGLYAQELISAKSQFSDSTLESTVRQRFLASQTGGLVYDEGRHVVIFGDSISFGSVSTSFVDKNWVSILRRNYLNEVGYDNHGFTSFKWTAIPDVHSVSRLGTWSDFEGGAAPGSPSGYYAASSDISATMTITVPVFKRRFTIMYQRGIGYGSFSIEVNGNIVATINSDGTGDADQVGTEIGFAKTNNFEIVGLDGAPNCVIRLIKNDSNRTSFVGAYYDNTPSQFSVDNFSTPGRRLYYASEPLIERAITGSDVFILALGHNDRQYIEASPALMSDFVDRVNWIKSYSLALNVKVIVLDFIWGKTLAESETRRVLNAMDIADNITVVPFPDFFGYSGTASTTDLINKYNLFVDDSHPNDAGHRMIGETVSKILGLSNSSAYLPIARQNWLPLQSMDSYLVNQAGTYQKVSSYKMDDKQVSVRVSLKNATNTAIAPGLYVLLNTGILTWRSTKRLDYSLSRDTLDGGYFSIDMNESGVISLRVRTGNPEPFISGEVTFNF